MNANTRSRLIDFTQAVMNLAHAVSSVAGTDAVQELYRAGNELEEQLDKDETIPD